MRVAVRRDGCSSRSSQRVSGTPKVRRAVFRLQGDPEQGEDVVAAAQRLDAGGRAGAGGEGDVRPDPRDQLAEEGLVGAEVVREAARHRERPAGEQRVDRVVVGGLALGQGGEDRRDAVSGIEAVAPGGERLVRTLAVFGRNSCPSSPKRARSGLGGRRSRCRAGGRPNGARRTAWRRPSSRSIRRRGRRRRPLRRWPCWCRGSAGR